MLGAAEMTGYHRPVKIPWTVVAGWYHAALLAALCWIVAWSPGWAPIVAAAVFAVHRSVDRTRATEPWSSALVVISIVAFMLTNGGWELTLGWILLALLVAVVARSLIRRAGSRPDAADFLAIGGWGVIFALSPRLIETQNGGWLAPVILLFVVQRLARARVEESTSDAMGPPSREVRGTLSLNNIVISGADALPQSVPINLELRAGDSVAILCDSPVDATSLAEVISGRRPPHAGEITVDGGPLEDEGRLAAVVAPGETFVTGDLSSNLSALTDRRLERSAVAAIHEACALNEVVDVLGDRLLEANGDPLTPIHRLLVLAARVIPSNYRIVVVVDPMPWVNAVRGELWRVAVVRASVGRTAIWITPDRELAERAGLVLEYRHGALRPPTQ
jgi:ABC-type multidrug transport system fused ATPase/permease subunit